MQQINVSLSQLKEKLLEAEKDGTELLELNIVPGQIEDGTMNPAFVHFEGILKDGSCMDYESIDESSVTEHLLMHMSA